MILCVWQFNQEKEQSRQGHNFDKLGQGKTRSQQHQGKNQEKPTALGEAAML